jgi:hypothetical protein
MPEVRLVGHESRSNRALFLASVESVDEWPAVVPALEPSFVAFVALDATGIEGDALCEFAKRLFDQGCVFSCSWGPDCERVHDCFDYADLDRLGWESDAADEFAASPWHEHETLAEALWFAVFSAWPAVHEASAVLAICEPRWAAEIEALLRDTDRWLEEVE